MYIAPTRIVEPDLSLISYAQSLFRDDAATLDNLREAVTMLEETGRIARRVMGGAHPLARDIESTLQNAREALAARNEA